MTKSTVPLRTPLFRGERRLRIALVGMPNAGKSTLFNAVSSISPQTGKLAGTHRTFGECTVQIGFDEASVVDLPSIHSLHHSAPDDQIALEYLLWGNERPPVSAHEPGGPPGSCSDMGGRSSPHKRYFNAGRSSSPRWCSEPMLGSSITLASSKPI